MVWASEFALDIIHTLHQKPLRVYCANHTSAASPGQDKSNDILGQHNHPVRRASVTARSICFAVKVFRNMLLVDLQGLGILFPAF
jgi:hypothetical protein